MPGVSAPNRRVSQVVSARFALRNPRRHPKDSVIQRFLMKTFPTGILSILASLSAVAAPITPELEQIRQIPEPLRAESLKRSGGQTGLEDGLYSPGVRTDERAGRNVAALARGQAFLEAMEAQDEAVANTAAPRPPPGTNDNVQVEIASRIEQEPGKPAPAAAEPAADGSGPAGDGPPPRPPERRP